MCLHGMKPVSSIDFEVFYVIILRKWQLPEHSCKVLNICKDAVCMGLMNLDASTGEAIDAINAAL